MKDRLPLYPGRVKLTPVPGQANVYDITRADQPTQEGDPLNKATLLKDATASLFGLGTDAVPDDVLALLSKAALYKKNVYVAQLSTLPEGSIIYLNENGSPVPFYVAKQGYEPGYNTGRVLVVRKEASTQDAWNSSGVNTYDGSTIDTWMNETYLPTLDGDVQAAIVTTNIPATSPRNSGVIRLNKAVFALSATELGTSGSNANVEGSALPISGDLSIAYINGGAITQWTRSPGTGNNYNAWKLDTSGDANYVGVSNAYGFRPAFTLPSTFIATLGPTTAGLYDVSDNLLLKLPGVQIATGSYVGTGKYGSGNPNSLTFEFAPKMLWIYAVDFSNAIYTCDMVLSKYLPISESKVLNYLIGSNTAYAIQGATFSENSVSWYSFNEFNQQNYTGYTYYYLAIG